MAMLTGSNGEFRRTLLTPQTYKPGQGVWTRNGTLVVAMVLVVYGMYSWSAMQSADAPFLKWGLPLILGAASAWIVFRLVHYPRFADFLITTEAEMNKVSWPSKGELKASTFVVLITSLIMAVFMFVYDMFWQWLLTFFGILRAGFGGLLGGGSQAMAPTDWLQFVETLAERLFV